MKEKGSSLKSFVPMTVYHQHVWWNYGYKLQLEDDKVKDGEDEANTESTRYSVYVLVDKHTFNLYRKVR